MNMVSRVRNVPVGEIAAINPKGPGSGTLSQDDLVDFLPMSDLSEDGTMAISAQRPYSEVAKGYTAFRGGDVLLAKITPCFENNKIGLADVATDWAFGSTEFHVLRPGKDVDSRYLLHFLRQDAIRMAGEKRMTGSGGQRRVPRSFLEELPIPLPPLAEQKRIAAILDQADALRRLRRRALDHLNTLGQAIFQEMFGTLDQGSGRWPQADLAEVLVDVTNGLTRRARPGEQGKQIVLRLKDIRDGYIDFDHPSRMSLTAKEEAKYRVAPGDLLFIRVNGNPEYVGRNAVFERHSEDAYFNDHVMRVRLNTARIEPTFLSHILNSAFGKSQIAVNRKTSAGQHTINQTGLGAIHVPLPPVQLQARFADRLRKASKKAEQFNLSAAQLDRLFSSLQHRAFTGQL